MESRVLRETVLAVILCCLVLSGGCRERRDGAPVTHGGTETNGQLANTALGLLEKWDENVSLNKDPVAGSAGIEFLKTEVLGKGVEGAVGVRHVIIQHGENVGPPHGRLSLVAVWQALCGTS